jgi:hypothetical protein
MSATTSRTTPSPLPLMELATSFWAFKTLASAYELDLFTRLARTAGTTAPELASELNIAERPAEMLLTGCASLGLLDKASDRYVNSALSEAYLVHGNPHHFGGLITMFDRRLYAGWDQLTQAIRTNRPTTWDPDKERSLFESADPAMLETFWDAMHAMSSFTARALGEALDLSGFRSLLDVGSGSAAFDIELCRLYPQLQATAYDFGFVNEIAARHIRAARLTDRIVTQDGDFFAQAMPEGHDLHVFSMVMQSCDEVRDRELLRKSYAALADGGAVIICELLVDDDKTGPRSAALMSLNMLIETEGRNYTSAEYHDWLLDAGFVEPQVVRFEAPGANGAVTARKPR